MAFFFLVGLYMIMSPSLGMAGQAVPGTTDQAAAIIEANRLLEEELKLAARPHIYMVLDLAAHVILIKSRGIELRRLSIAGWRQPQERSPTGVFRLRARPSVNRPKAAAGDDNSPATAIELEDMPARYDLIFDPGLIISVGQPVRERPWPWVKDLAHEWWTRLAPMLGIVIDAGRATVVRMHLTLEQETARTLAWTMTDGMALIVGAAAIHHD